MRIITVLWNSLLLQTKGAFLVMSKGIHHDDSDIVSLIQSQIISKDCSLKYHSFLAYKVYAMHPLQNLIRWPDDERLLILVIWKVLQRILFISTNFFSFALAAGGVHIWAKEKSFGQYFNCTYIGWQSNFGW